MVDQKRVSIIHSLRTQLTLGASALLILTVATIGYFLTLHQKEVLTSELEKTVVLQGRNIALSSAKSLLRADPEFELYPLVNRLLRDSVDILSITIVDDNGTIQGHEDLVMIGKLLRPEREGYTIVTSPLLRTDENFMVSKTAYRFTTPVISAGTSTGSVTLEYSKGGLISGIRTAVELTIRIVVVALVVGLLLSLLFFGRISRPLRVMLDGVKKVGEGDLTARISMPTKNEFHILANSFNAMSERLLATQQEMIAKERLDRELEIASEIQHSLIPSSVEPPAGYLIGQYYQSAREVGGDYLDIIQIDEHRTGYVVADVCGKGIPALIIMAMVKILAQEFVSSGRSPQYILRALNQTLHKNMQKNMFVTFFVGILDTRVNRLTFSNAGHNPLLIFNHKTQQARFFKMDGVPLGAFDSTMFDNTVKDYQIEFCPGDVALQYTDGLNESHNSSGEQFGTQRILDIASLQAGNGALAIVDCLAAAEKQFRGSAQQFDDIALLSIGSLVRKPALTEKA